jgi:hypothetical protein
VNIIKSKKNKISPKQQLSIIKDNSQDSPFKVVTTLPNTKAKIDLQLTTCKSPWNIN